MVYSITWNAAFEATPADSDDASEGASRIRNLALAVRERMEADHYWDEGGTDADHGLHKQVTFQAQVADPTCGTDQPEIYSKDISAGNATPFVAVESNKYASLFVPAGIIVPFIPGYFGDGSNGSYTNVLGAGNTVAEINAYLNPLGWYVCDGAALNHSVSPIFNGANRYLPNLTDDRFFMGDTVVGGVGGSSTMTDHSHTGTAASDGAHSHGIPTVNGGNFPATSNVGSGSGGSSTASTSSAGAHTHTVSVGSGDNPGTASVENRPKYLGGFMIMKVV